MLAIATLTTIAFVLRPAVAAASPGASLDVFVGYATGRV
jgi:hypothetical protein